MFENTAEGATASPLSPADPTPPNTPPSDHEVVRHMLFGSVGAVRATIHLLHKLNYAEPNDWSQPMPTGRSREVMAILTKRMRLG